MLAIEKLKNLKLTAFADNCVGLSQECESQSETPLSFLEKLADLELERRKHIKIERLIKQAQLPRQKLLKDFQVSRIPSLTQTKVDLLAQPDFINRCENLLVFGNPGTGKTHLALALAQEWCLHEKRVLFTTAATLTQNLLKAKVALSLNSYIKRLNKFEMLIIDDISYISCNRDETDVLFALLSERYEMHSVMITSNVSFAGWENIFKDKMTTAAAIDRLVHHATILELNAESYRIKSAKSKKEVKHVK